MKIRITSILCLCFVALFADQDFKVMSYNALNFSDNSQARADYFKLVIQTYDPDIIVMQEVIDNAGATVLLNSFNENSAGYAKADFVNGYDTDNMLYYKTAEISLTGQNEITTALRDINEYIVEIAGNSLHIFSCHLKASSGGTNENLRLQEILQLRAYIQTLPSGSEYLIVGDMNFYSSSELAYQNLTTTSPLLTDDLCTSVGSWHNSSSYSNVHTQSTRIEQFGGGSTGGMDDRFDFIFSSPDLTDNQGIEYIPSSYIAFGNDGNHYNQSINNGTNSAVSSEVADALYYASDHLPVCAEFTSIGSGSGSGSGSGNSNGLIISEYIEGSSYNKAIELYNGSGETINLSSYILEKDANGNNNWVNSVELSGSLENGECYVVANFQANAVISGVTDLVSNGVANFNGDDQVRLLKDGYEIDRIGIPGDITFGSNVTYVRQDTVQVGKPNSQDPRSNGEWIAYASDTTEHLGTHSQISLNNPPTISEVIINPANPTIYDTVDVTAILQDSEGTIELAYCNWGFSSDNLEFQINLIDEGPLYRLESQIPEQSAGEIFFQIYCEDDLGEGTIYNSSYLVSLPDDYYTIAEIQGDTDISPYNGEIVNTSGLVTAISPDGFYIQDGTAIRSAIFCYGAVTVSQGDEISIIATVEEYYGKTELKDFVSVTVISSGNTLLEAIELTTNEAGSEDYESMLVYVPGLLCDEILQYNEWNGLDQSGSISIDDQIHFFFPGLGFYYDVIGVVNYNYNTYKLEPRSSADIVLQLDSPRNVEISHDGTIVTISWNAVNGASTYRIEESNIPDGVFGESLGGTLVGSSWNNIENSNKKFYRVIAVE